MIKTMNYVNLSDLAAELNIENKTDFLFFWGANNSIGSFLFCDKKELQDLIKTTDYLEASNFNHYYIQKAKNQINAINLLRTKYGITDKIFVFFD